jgi:DNA primase
MQNPAWYETLPSAAVLESLANAPAPENPLEAAPDQASRVLLARALEQAPDPNDTHSAPASPEEQVADALHALEHRYLERRLRELRLLIAEAERRNDPEMVIKLTTERMQLDRTVREH